jgi:hypothetical protein
VVFGGLANGYFLNDIWLYEVNRNYWQQLSRGANVASGRASPAVATLASGDLLLFGPFDRHRASLLS